MSISVLKGYGGKKGKGKLIFIFSLHSSAVQECVNIDTGAFGESREVQLLLRRLLRLKFTRSLLAWRWLASYRFYDNWFCGIFPPKLTQSNGTVVQKAN